MLILGRMQLPCVSEKDAFAGLFPGRNFVVHTHNIDGYDVMNYMVTCLHVFWKFDIHPVKDWFKDLQKKKWLIHKLETCTGMLVFTIYVCFVFISRNYVCLFVHSCFLIGLSSCSVKLMLFFYQKNCMYCPGFVQDLQRYINRRCQQLHQPCLSHSFPPLSKRCWLTERKTGPLCSRYWSLLTSLQPQ